MTGEIFKETKSQTLHSVGNILAKIVKVMNYGFLCLTIFGNITVGIKMRMNILFRHFQFRLLFEKSEPRNTNEVIVDGLNEKVETTML